jgi:hypothetical protein
VDYSIQPRAIYLAPSSVNDPEIHRWLTADYKKMEEFIDQPEFKDTKHVDVPLPDPQALTLSDDMLLTWFVLDELPYLRMLVEEGGECHEAFKVHIRTISKDKLFIPFLKEDSKYYLRVFKPALQRLIRSKKERFDRDLILMNANEGITLLLRPLAGNRGIEQYKNMARRDCTGVAQSDKHVHFMPRLTMTFEDYVDEPLLQRKLEQEAKERSKAVQLGDLTASLKEINLKELQKQYQGAMRHAAMVQRLVETMQAQDNAQPPAKMAYSMDQIVCTCGVKPCRCC